MNDERRRLLWHGMLLFFLGQVTGLFQANLVNPRMGLSAHLEGILNGLFLLAVGLVWEDVRLPRRWKTLARWLVVYGAYANWLVTLVAAVFGTGSMTPLAAAGRQALPWQEIAVTVGFVSVGIAMLGAVGLLLAGLRRRR
ncbi:hypothetical protein [Tahibacter amnicola]|uniref:Hydroxylaminobenzene mutase n=1 Tax=Tahibacter amnicola TaxID=2976241 RepID=A0ABY6BBV8_9GAMM|nr:hypothetical protein [Tahibacter amnicola]UXI67349.1 hypothetical protein N4264_21830 [Tahibacter amnicola]